MLCFALLSAYIQIPLLFTRTTPSAAKQQGQGSNVSSLIRQLSAPGPDWEPIPECAEGGVEMMTASRSISVDCPL